MSTEEEGDWGLELRDMFTSHFFPSEIAPHTWERHVCLTLISWKQMSTSRSFTSNVQQSTSHECLITIYI